MELVGGFAFSPGLRLAWAVGVFVAFLVKVEKEAILHHIHILAAFQMHLISVDIHGIRLDDRGLHGHCAIGVC